MAAAEQIKAMVSMQDVLGRYGIDVGRGGFISCPFHSEKTASCKIYDNSFYCFGCGAGGDVIRFVMLLFNLEYPQAVQKIDTDFSLGLLKKPTLTKYRLNKQAENTRKVEQEEKERQLSYNKYTFDRLCEYYKWVQKLPDSKARQFDIAFMERLLDKYLDPNVIIKHNVDALLASISTKHREVTPLVGYDGWSNHAAVGGTDVESGDDRRPL